MKYSETNFRALYHNFCAFELTDNIRPYLSGFPYAPIANYVLVYGYIDPEEGLMLEVIAAAYKTDDGFKFGETDPLIRSNFRISAAEDVDFYYFEDEDGELRNMFDQKLYALRGSRASDALEATRQIMALDALRHPEFPDDVKVLLLKEGTTPEICWTRLISGQEQSFTGLLVNEPNPGFGYHAGERISIRLEQADDGNFFCYANLNPTQSLSQEDLEDGSLLRHAIASFNAEPTDNRLMDILELLRDNLVWVPSVDEENIIPDLLHYEDENYILPVFTAIDEMGEYGDCFAKLQRPFLNVIKAARENPSNISAIAVNAFTEPFILESEFWNMLEMMESRIVQ